MCFEENGSMGRRTREPCGRAFTDRFLASCGAALDRRKGFSPGVAVYVIDEVAVVISIPDSTVGVLSRKLLASAPSIRFNIARFIGPHIICVSNSVM
mmetsp:Transcript_65371/g.121870  ORF Transcript_65371/g.121870 Transcript_65371/m.121870 type:complete len:97 (-) Transcript_65371:2105-2395(-)